MGGGKGVLIQVDKSATLSTSVGFQTLFQPVVFNGAQVTSPQNVQTQKPGDPCYALTTDGRNYVVYKGDGSDGGDNCFAVIGDHENRPTDMTNLIVEAKRHVEGIDLYNQASTGDKSLTITAARTDPNHIPCVAYWDGTQTVGTLTANNAGGNQRMPDKENFNCVIEKYPSLQDTTGSLLASGYDKNGTQEASNGMYLVQRDNIRYTIRRLTPLECERLQGYPDGWTDIGDYIDTNGKKRKIADSARYKALGNSIALPSWKFVLKRLCANYERPATLASLFDGIGGFPLIWEGINGEGSCRWASEIEEFPIAVTKRRFGHGRCEVD